MLRWYKGHLHNIGTGNLQFESRHLLTGIKMKRDWSLFYAYVDSFGRFKMGQHRPLFRITSVLFHQIHVKISILTLHFYIWASNPW